MPSFPVVYPLSPLPKRIRTEGQSMPWDIFLFPALLLPINPFPLQETRALGLNRW